MSWHGIKARGIEASSNPRGFSPLLDALMPRSLFREREQAVDVQPVDDVHLRPVLHQRKREVVADETGSANQGNRSLTQRDQ